MENELKGHWTFRECYDYLLRTGQIPYDEFAIDWPKEFDIAIKVLMPKLNLKENPIIIESTPNERKGFFYNLWKENND